MTTRHLYNQTQQSWNLTFEGGSLPDLPGATGQGAYWSGTMGPGATVTLVFIQSSGQIDIGATDGSDSAQYSFSTNAFGSDPSWQHNGDTPGISLNSPADGDMQLFGKIGQQIVSGELGGAAPQAAGDAVPAAAAPE